MVVVVWVVGGVEPEEATRRSPGINRESALNLFDPGNYPLDLQACSDHRRPPPACPSRRICWLIRSCVPAAALAFPQTDCRCLGSLYVATSTSSWTIWAILGASAHFKLHCGDLTLCVQGLNLATGDFFLLSSPPPKKWICQFCMPVYSITLNLHAPYHPLFGLGRCTRYVFLRELYYIIPSAILALAVRFGICVWWLHCSSGCG